MNVQKIDLLPFSPLQSKALRLGPGALATLERLKRNGRASLPFLLVYGAVLAAGSVLVALFGATHRILFGDLRWLPPVAMVVAAVLAMLFAIGYAKSRLHRHQAWMMRECLPGPQWLRTFLPVAQRLQEHAAQLAANGVTEPDEQIVTTINAFLLGDEPGYVPPRLVSPEERRRREIERRQREIAARTDKYVEQMFGAETMAWVSARTAAASKEE